MSQQIINIGVLPNDGSGDPLRTAFNKINNNFSELFSTNFSTEEAYTVGSGTNQVVFQTPIDSFTQGRFQINSIDPITLNSQNVTISAAKKNDGTSVRFSAYATLFEGSPVTTYDMDVLAGNVRVLCSPLVTSVLTHFVAYQIMNVAPTTPGLALALDGYPVDTLILTENDMILSTEL
jgi:hypothetical protein